jgi:hypothetical protein
MLSATLHAIQRYRERVGPRPPRFPGMLPLEAAADDLLAAMRHPLFCIPLEGGSRLLGCRNRAGIPFLVKTGEDPHRAESCGAYYFWHEAREAWAKVGVHTAPRKSRGAAWNARKLAKSAQHRIRQEQETHDFAVPRD